jgi:hypothetical protein
VSGWGEPPAAEEDPAPRSHWTRPETVDPLSARQLIRRAWRLYRSTPRRFLLVASGPELLRDLFAIPSFVLTGTLVQAMAGVLGDYFDEAIAHPGAYAGANSQAIQAELRAQLQAVMVPNGDLSFLAAVGSGIGAAIALVGASMVAAAALSTTAGRPISVAQTFRLVASRRGLVGPIVAIGIGWVVVSLLPLVVQSSGEFQSWAGTAGSPRSVLVGSLLSLLGVLVAVGAVILAVRWALFIPVVLVEGLGVGAGLRRAAQLSHGIRMRLFLAIAATFLLYGLSVEITAGAFGLALGLAAGSLTIGLVALLVAVIVGNLLWAPVLPALLVLAYRQRAQDAPFAPADEPGPASI